MSPPRTSRRLVLRAGHGVGATAGAITGATLQTDLPVYDRLAAETMLYRRPPRCHHVSTVAVALITHRSAPSG
jgi:hypothetical protein